jgi:hypothetical protein
MGAIGNSVRLFVVVMLAAALSLGPRMPAQSPTPSKISLTTEDRVQAPGWWPTKGTAPLDDFVGTAECAKCHEKIALTYIHTPMAQASAPAAYSQVLRSHDSLSAEHPPYRYELARDSATVNFSVTDGSASLSTAVLWAFGLGHKGQTYLYRDQSTQNQSTQHSSKQRESGPRPAAFYESRLSFYGTLDGLDLTTGHDAAAPDGLESALGRRMDPDETRRCFGCHTSLSTTANRFDPSHVTPGVACEACHGPGANHVDAMKSGKIANGRRAIFDPRRLEPVASVDFCGACHRTWADVLQGGFTGVINARFQPYRLEISRCWQGTKGDARLTCIACHDPHQPLVRDASSYDPKCLACHSATSKEKAGAGHPATAACPVATKDCVTCHMPKVELPSMHAPFADHRIRIARAGEPYPN